VLAVNYFQGPWKIVEDAYETYCIKVPYVFQRCTRHLHILGARKGAWNKFHAEYSQILGATGQNLRTPDLRVSGENKR